MFSVPRSVRAAAAALLLTGGVSVALIATEAGAAAAPDHGRRAYAVTLVTGDRVTVGPGTMRIDKAPGREQIPFLTAKTKSGLSVIPADAGALIAAGTVDRRLFDVSLLHRLGYDDATAGSVPLMVTSTGDTARVRSLAGARDVRTLPAAGLTAMRTAKTESATFWTSWTRTRPGKLWLVGKLRPALDVSVPQIGAPQAWAAGHTGAGVTVAVLDTGVDAAHPDLAGVIDEMKDFTGSDDGMADEASHGTHVASIIAGTGAASGGRYTGVAKDVRLKIGKVCEWDCPEDAIVAGMEWAARSGARVVNMSLGAEPEEVGDFLADTVNRLSANTGVLFVVSAGNGGGPETVSSPGTADSALTVGSVDKVTDALSPYSSQGPRVLPSRRADYAVKPDITAPGRDIMAARPGGTVAGGDAYVSYSGTSMAAPHVAGAAAILAGAHPDWTGPRLKTTLMSTARVIDGQTVYQQGAGRVDVAAATTATVTATGSLSLGYFPYGQPAGPATKKVIYRNDGPADVTLDLALTVGDAPAGMFRAGQPSVVVPAGSTAAVDVTVDPALGATGLYSGTLAATGPGGIRAHTAIGAYKEATAYNLSFTQLGPTRANMTHLLLINQETGAVGYSQMFERTWLRRLPAGRYTVMTTTFDAADNPGDGYTAVAETRQITLDRSTELIFDTRNAKPVEVSVAGVPDAAPLADIQFDTAYRTDGLGIVGPPGRVKAVPGQGAIDGFAYGVLAPMGRAGTVPTPWTYNVAVPGAGRIPASPSFTVRRADLATVTQKISSQSPQEQRDLQHAGHTPAGLGYSYAVATPLGDQRTRTDHFTTAPGTSFTSIFVSGSDLYGENSADYESYVPKVTREPGTRGTAHWNRGVFGPGLVPEAGYDGTRDGDRLHIGVPLLSARDHVTYSGWTDTVHTELSAGGQVLAEADDFALDAELPAGPAEYRVRTTLTRTEPWVRMSRRVDATWTFTSARTSARASLPLQVVRFLPALDENNTAPAGEFRFGVRVDRALGAPEATVTRLAVQVSYDDGGTWSPAPVTGAGDRRTVTVDNPAGGAVSLRATATDSAGNQVRQTVIGAYPVAAQR